MRNAKGVTHFHVKWVGYEAKHNTWEPIENLASCEDMIAEFKEREKTRIAQLEAAAMAKHAEKQEAAAASAAKAADDAAAARVAAQAQAATSPAAAAAAAAADDEASAALKNRYDLCVHSGYRGYPRPWISWILWISLREVLYTP